MPDTACHQHATLRATLVSVQAGLCGPRTILVLAPHPSPLLHSHEACARAATPTRSRVSYQLVTTNIYVMDEVQPAGRMSAAERRDQLVGLAAEEFAAGGLHGASTEKLARRAGITQAYIFRIFGTKKALFLEVVDRAFDRLVDGMAHATAPDKAQSTTPDDARRSALAGMGQFYDRALGDRTGLLVQLQAFAACGDAEVRDRVRHHLERMWKVVSERSGLPPVAVKSFLAFGMLLNASAAVQTSEVDAAWADGIRTRIHAGLFAHITDENNQ